MNLFGVGPAEAGLVFVITLIVVGPQRFPEMMRSAGRWYRMARAYSNEVMKDVRAAVDDIEREVKAETDDLRSVRELADVGDDLAGAEVAAREAHAQTREAVQAANPDAPAPARQPGAKDETDRAARVRPSQRTEASGTPEPESAQEAVPPIEAAPVPPKSEPAAEEATPATTFDPFKREQPSRGPKRTSSENGARAAEDAS